VNLHDIESELASLRAENAALREQITRHCERVASQADALSRVAERSATARLEAWSNKHDAYFEIDPFWVILDPRCSPRMAFYRCPSEERMFHRGVDAIVVGTDEKPATLDEMIDAALKRWEELYGGK